MKKQWYSFMLWGRLSYDPALPDTLFERTLAARFPRSPGGQALCRFDGRLADHPADHAVLLGRHRPEVVSRSLRSPPRRGGGFYTVRHFMTGETMPGSGIVNIREYCDRQVKGQPVTGITPPQVAAALADDSRRTLELLEQMPEKSADKELRLTLGDLRAMAHLGNYYAEKITGATDLALYDKTGRVEQQPVGHKAPRIGPGALAGLRGGGHAAVPPTVADADRVCGPERPDGAGAR